MATAIWSLENGQNTIAKKHPDRFRTFFACFRLFSNKIRPFLHFLLAFALFEPSVSDRFWAVRFRIFRHRSPAAI